MKMVTDISKAKEIIKTGEKIYSCSCGHFEAQADIYGVSNVNYTKMYDLCNDCWNTADLSFAVDCTEAEPRFSNIESEKATIKNDNYCIQITSIK